jgi:hypothetical protein
VPLGTGKDGKPSICAIWLVAVPVCCLTSLWREVTFWPEGDGPLWSDRRRETDLLLSRSGGGGLRPKAEFHLLHNSKIRTLEKHSNCLGRYVPCS